MIKEIDLISNTTHDFMYNPVEINKHMEDPSYLIIPKYFLELNTKTCSQSS